MSESLWRLLLPLGVSSLLLALPLHAEELHAEDLASPPAAALADGLDAREIYRRVLENRFLTSTQTLTLTSYDRAGTSQELEVRMAWARYEVGTKERGKGITTKSLLRYLLPKGLRGTGYLVINKLDAPNDQFVYFPSMRRVRRINLRGETIAGTDLSVEDLLPRELDDASYARIPDVEQAGEPCFAIEATPTAEAESAYLKLLLVVEKEHYVPLRTRYWDNVGLEVKELTVAVDSITEIEGVWFPMRSSMRHLVERTRTDLEVRDLEANPELSSRRFSQRTLESGRIR